MALDAGSVFAVLGGKFNPAGFAQFDAAMKKSTASAAAAEKSHNRTASAMTALGGAAKTGAAVGLVAVGYALVKSVQSASTFEKKMSELQAVTKASAGTMKTMSEAALDLGAKTGVGATEAAGALTELAKGGLDANTSIAALSGTIALAQSGDMQLADAANTVVKSLSLFALKGADAGHVADGLASAANATSMDVKDFAQALAQGGSAAAAAGFSFDDTINVMAAMANKFQSGSDMGTSLKTTLTQMANPSKKAADEMKRLSISLFDTHGKMKPVADIVTMLTARFQGMSDKQRLSTAATIAGTDGMRTLLALTGSSGRNIIQSGAATDIAAKKMDNFSGSMQKFKAEFQTLGIELGTLLLPGLAQSMHNFSATLQAMRGDFSNFGVSTLGVVRGIVAAISTAASVMRLVPGPIGDMWAKVGDAAQRTINNIDAATSKLRQKKLAVKVTADANQAIYEIGLLARSPIKNKIQRVLGDSSDAKTKIAALVKMGIPPKTAKLLADTGSARNAIQSLRDQIAGLHDKTIHISTIQQVIPGKGRAIGSGNASGARAGSAHTSLVGEGGGPEWIVDRSTGKARKVTGAQMASLNANEYVIPTESKYRPQALGLLSMLAADLGVAGFKKGKSAPKKLTKAEKKAQKRLYAREDGKIQAASDSATLYETRMNTAETKGDEKLWGTNHKLLADALKLELNRIGSALKLKGKFAPKGARLTTLKQHQAEVEGLIATGALAKFPAAEIAAETTYSAIEQAQLDEFGRQIALAELTPEITDDQAALAGKASLLSSILSGAGNGAGRGGVTAVTQIASELKSTRDQIAGLAGGTSSAPDIGTPGITADQQAQADQAARNQTMAAQSAAIDRLVGATMGGSPTLVFQSYVPPSPTEARRLADYTVGGIGYQGATQSSKDSVGI